MEGRDKESHENSISRRKKPRPRVLGREVGQLVQLDTVSDYEQCKKR